MASAFVVGFLAAIWFGLNTIGSSTFVSDRLRSVAESSLHRVLGPNYQASVGPARFAVDGASRVALNFSSVGLADADSSTPILQAQNVSFVLRLLPLLSGKAEIDALKVSGANLKLGGLRSGEGDAFIAFRGASGAIEPKLVPDLAFTALDKLVAAVRSGATDTIEFEDISLDIGAAEPTLVESISVTDAGSAVVVTGRLQIAGEPFEISGNIDASSNGQRAEGFSASLASVAREAAAESAPGRHVSLVGTRANAGQPSELRLTLRSGAQSLDLGNRGLLAGSIDVGAQLASNSDKLEIERFDVDLGRSVFRSSGAIAPIAASSPTYRFELVGNDALISPSDSTEQPLEAAVRLAGNFFEADSRLDVSELAVRASSGEVNGRAAVRFATGRTPGISLDIGLAGMSVEQVKQLWPWIAATGARRWVMQNLFGGTVTEGRVRYDVGVGRFEDPAPLNKDEVSGRFVVANSRFDTVGALPAIREANGEVAFAGNGADITLSSGIAYLPSGKALSVGNGILRIPDASVRPLIGKLEMDVKGAADAAAELASLKPIDAFSRLDFKPQDLTGAVEGRVRADIPIIRASGPTQLDWQVDLKFSDLDVLQPFEGQAVTEADGSLSVDPSQVEIKAKAKLNGIPADLEIVRPVGGSDVVARQDIELVLDDKTREAVAPGLNTVLSGPVSLKVEGPPGARTVEADLRPARLTLPWVGWSKGAGIPAKASFVLAGNPGSQEIRDFRLEGKSFSARGALSLSKGELASAKFDRLTLNGDDVFSVAIKRDARTLNIDVEGDAYDARSLIKEVQQTLGKGSDGGRSSTRVQVNARLQRIIGFGNETISSAAVRYAGSGLAGADLTLDGVTSSGSSISINHNASGAQREIQMTTGDAGDVLRFLNLYGRMRGGAMELSMSGQNTLRGRLDIKDFTIVNEPKLGSIVTNAPKGGDRSLSQASGGKIDTGRVKFDRGYVEFEQGNGTLSIANGVLRGPVIGTTFQGTVYDARDRMDLTGTFMPAYGLNSIFGDIPVLGELLGNGRNGGLIGITYRLRGETKSPTLEVNPLSVIAPGIFRSIFEY